MSRTGSQLAEYHNELYSTATVEFFGPTEIRAQVSRPVPGCATAVAWRIE